MTWKAALLMLSSALSLGFAMWFGYTSLWVLAVFVTLLLFCAAIMWICSYWLLSFEQVLLQAAVEKHTEAQLAVRCRNKGIFLYPRVQLFYRSKDRKTVAVYPGEQEVLIGYVFSRKGTYFVGLEKILAYDAFGIFCRRIRFRQPATLYVLPHAGEVQEYAREEMGKVSEEGAKKKLVEDRTTISDLREYQYGDMLNSINWKATAKHNEVIVNRYENSFCTRTLIFVDGNSSLTNPYLQGILDDYACDLALTRIKSVLAQQGMITLFYGGQEEMLDSNTVKSFREFGIYLAKNVIADVLSGGSDDSQDVTLLEKILLQKDVYSRAVFYLRHQTPQMQQLMEQLMGQHIVVECHQIALDCYGMQPQDTVVTWREGDAVHA